MVVNYAYQLYRIEDSVSSLIIGDDVMVNETLSLTNHSHLRFIVIGANSCEGTTSLVIEECHMLRSIQISDNSFQPIPNNRKPKNAESVCTIRKCMKLFYIDFGCNSFCDYSNLILEDLKQINSIIIGKGTFEKLPRVDIECRSQWTIWELAIPSLKDLLMDNRLVHIK